MQTARAKKLFLEAKAGLSPRTIEQYEDALGHLVASCPNMPETPEPLQRALNKAPTVWVKDAWFRCWRCFFRWSHRRWQVINPMEEEENLKVERPILPEIEMRYSGPEELARIFASAKTPEEKAILALSLDAGVRGSEFGRLRTLDIGQDTVRLYGKGSREVLVPIIPELRVLLQVVMRRRKKRQQRPQDLVFPGPSGCGITRSGVYQLVERCMIRAGIQGPKRGPHRLRHSLGSNWVAAGGDPFTLKRIMRHRNIKTTLKYVNLSIETVIDKHNQYTPLRGALRGAQGVLIKREVEEVLDRAEKYEVVVKA